MGNSYDDFLISVDSIARIDDTYFLLKNEQSQFCFCYKDAEGEIQTKSAVYKDISYITGLDLFIGTDIEMDAVGVVDVHGEELVPCIFQTAVTTSNKIVLVDYFNKAHEIIIEDGKSVRDALLQFSKGLKLKDVFLMGKRAGMWEMAEPVYRKRDISSEEKRWAGDRDAE